MSTDAMRNLSKRLARIQPVDDALRARAQQQLDRKTKPLGSLGRLEELAAQLCAITGEAQPQLTPRAVVVLAADHGVAAEGLSAYPQQVTRQMLVNFANRGAAINVLCRQASAQLVVADLGVCGAPVEHPAIHGARVAQGTRPFTQEPAMSEAQTHAAIDRGAALVDGLAEQDSRLIALGEMGIGNTTSASAIHAALAGLSPEQVTGRGTGIDDATLKRKAKAIGRALSHHRLERSSDPLHVLRCVGGLEIAGLVGAILEGCARRMPVLLDGYITGAAALVAQRLCPASAGYMIASHRSGEQAHGALLEELQCAPLLDLDLRLGEGSAAALSLPLLDAALAILSDMATFESAAVSEALP